MKTIEMTAYGKINLGLDVIRKLENGYHELDMVMQTVTLADTIGFEVLEEDEIILTTNKAELSTGEDNLVYQAIAGMKEEFQIKNGIKAHLVKNIPMAAGMAVEKCTDEEIERLKEIVDLQEFYMEKGDPEKIKQMDNNFHAIFCKKL